VTSQQRNLHNEPVHPPKASEPRKKTFSIHVSEETFHQLQSLRDIQAKEAGCRGSYNMAVKNLLSLKTTHDQLQQKYDHLHESQSHQFEQENHYLKELLMQSLNTPKNYAVHPSPYPSPNPNPYSSPYPNISPYPNSGSLMPGSPYPGSVLNPPPGSSIPPPRKKISNYAPPNTKNLRSDYQKEIHQIFTGELLKPSEIVQTTQPVHVDSGIQEIAEDFCIPQIESISTAKRFQHEALPMEA